MSLLKRIIFCLYYKDGFFYISRNFRLQKVGNVEWLIKNFGFVDTLHTLGLPFFMITMFGLINLVMKAYNSVKNNA